MPKKSTTALFNKPYEPKYKALKELILERISGGVYKPGDKIGTEFEFVEELSVSRMTVNRALRELTHEGVLIRVAGLGTFVAEQPKQSALIELKNIAEEISNRGHAHTSSVELLREEIASNDVVNALGLSKGDRVYHSIVIHFENDTPVQLEDRYILATFASGYLDQDFTTTTPFEYLLSCGPVTEVEHTIEAVLPRHDIAEKLKITKTEPCLLLTRRTWTGDVIVTFSHFYHPGNSYKLGSRYQLNKRPK